MGSGNKRRSYENKFLELSNRVERWLCIAMSSLFVLLLLFQILLGIDAFRPLLSIVDRLEGSPYEHSGPQQRLEIRG